MNHLSPSSPSPAEIIEATHLAGIIGAGGGGFPTHIKLSSSVDTVIANGSECEPLLASDKSFMKEFPHKVIAGLRLAMTATNATKGVIAIKAHYHDAISALKSHLSPNDPIQLHFLQNYYPAGDEFLTVYDVTRRIIPEGGFPPHVGVLTANVLSLAQIADAICGKPVTSRPITITGSVKSPQVITAPIGATYANILELAGGTNHPSDIILDGGPMMGQIIQNPHNGIAKTTSAILALPADHIIPRFKNTSLSLMIKKSKSACCQCFRCTDLCPRNLLGHNLHPHMTMRTIDYNLAQPTHHITSAFLCSQCGLCELFACDFMLLSPRQIYAEYRRLLTEKGIQNPHHHTPQSTSPELPNRKIPLNTLIQKLNLTPWLAPTPNLGNMCDKIKTVHIPLNRHNGPPSIPTVQTGQPVKCGDIIATPPENQYHRGVFHHASISGYVQMSTNEKIILGAAPPADLQRFV